MKQTLISMAALFFMVTINPHSDEPVPHVSPLCATTFDRFKQVPKHLCCEATVCLDDVALVMQRSSDSRLIVVGNATTLEKTSKTRGYARTLDASRALVVKDYFVRDKGIEASRVEVRVGHDGTSTVSNFLVPPHADVDADLPRTTRIKG